MNTLNYDKILLNLFAAFKQNRDRSIVLRNTSGCFLLDADESIHNLLLKDCLILVYSTTCILGCYHKSFTYKKDLLWSPRFSASHLSFCWNTRIIFHGASFDGIRRSMWKAYEPFVLLFWRAVIEWDVFATFLHVVGDFPSFFYRRYCGGGYEHLYGRRVSVVVRKK